MARTSLFVVFLVLQLIHLACCRSVKDSNVLVSDGLDDKFIGQSSSLQQVVNDDDLETDMVTCDPIYGFLPCATSFLGLAFLVIVYEILFHLATNYVTRGSELFFKMYGTGIFGASAFHLVGTISQVGIVLVTGVTATAETAEAMVTMNITMVAGSAIMLLTLVWGLVVLYGSYDISESPTTGYCVTTDEHTLSTARIMMVSLIPFFILQVAKFLSSASGIRIVILVSLPVSIALLVTYCIYQIFRPWIQERRHELLVIKYEMSNMHSAKTWRNLLKAGFFLIVGIGITLLLAVPLMETMQAMCTAASIPTFLSSCILIPSAINYGFVTQAMSSVKNRASDSNVISLTLSEVFLFRNLASLYISVLTFLTSILAFIMYPISVLMIYILTTYLGWT